MGSANSLESDKQQGEVTGSLDREIPAKKMNFVPVTTGPGQAPIPAIARTNGQGRREGRAQVR